MLEDNVDLYSNLDPDPDRDLARAFGLAVLPPPPPPRRWPRPPADELIREMVDIIVSQFHPLAIILFGSRARGNHQPNSDVDLLIVLPSVADKRSVAAAIGDSLGHVPIAKDVIVTTRREIVEERDVDGSLIDRAMRGGKVLYDIGR